MIFLPVSDILDAAQAVTPFTYGELIGSDRHRHLSRARFACAWIARRNGHSFPMVAKRLGRKDHSTIIHACRQCEAFMERDKHYRRMVFAIWREALRNVRKRQASISRAASMFEQARLAA